MFKYGLPRHSERALGSSEFDKFSEAHVDDFNDKPNYCVRCDIPAQIVGAVCVCPRCGEEQRLAKLDISHPQEAVKANVVIRTGPKNGTLYHVPRESASSRGKAVLDQLIALKRLHTCDEASKQTPDNVIYAVAEKYNQIQTADHIVNGEEKPFVRRGVKKDQILAALVQLECKKQGATRDERTIAEFMNLPTDGFAQGMATLSKLSKRIDVQIDTDAVSIDGFIDSYTESLGISTPRYKKFIREIVEESERKQICMTSQLSSKVVGAIWLVITKEKLNIPTSKVEAAADRIKKNTFIKFTNAVLANIVVFARIFTTYNIPI